MDKVPRVGIGVFVWKDGKFIMGQRKGAHGADSWSVPGGHLEFGESWETCAAREVLEETGMTVKNPKLFAVCNDIFEDEGKHYVTIWITTEWESGEPTIIEPDKFIELQWRSFADLPDPLFLSWNQLKKVRPEFFPNSSQNS